MITKYVNAWTYEGGGGFNYYANQEHRDAAHEVEKLNARNYTADKWKAFSFEVEVSSEENAVSEIDAVFNSIS